jgi:hypothetical protein
MMSPPPILSSLTNEIIEKHRTLSRDNAYTLPRPAQRAALATGTVEIERCSPGQIVDVLDPWRHEVVCFRGRVTEAGSAIAREVRDERKTIHEVPTYTTVRVVPPEEM